ncbi:serine/threonine-protein kinase [Nocardiopsis sp. NPDC006198]|uniref:serine/threonine-protein kinase n=1 Tax=Nocardiopsis sp. NPDC006198 TaxID=3154472 RepID=UPI0033A75825
MQHLAPRDPRRVGPYRTVALLGAGGMGRVYLGIDREGRTAAVKVVRAEYAYDPDFRERFARELDLARRVHGAHTPRVLDADTSGRTPWMATEYVRGPSLHDLVRSVGPLPEDSVRFAARGVAQALERVHSHGLVHRDLKPGNVMVSAAGPQVIDFGIAAALEDAGPDGDGRLVGTPGYMAPENIRREPGGAAADVFALGGMIVYALTGTGPFGEGHPSAVMYRITNQDPVLTGIPERLHGLVSACLDKDPRERPSASRVLHALGGPAAPPTTASAWLPPPAVHVLERIDGEYRDAVAAAGPGAAGGAPASRARRRPLLVGAAGAALLLTAGAGTWALAGPFGGGTAEEDPGRRVRCDLTEHIAPELAEAARPVPSIPSSSVPPGTVFSADGRVLVVAGSQGLALWDWEEGTEIARIEDEVPGLSPTPLVSPDGCRVGYNGTGVHVYVAGTGEHTVYRGDVEVVASAFDPDGEGLYLVEGTGEPESAVLRVDLETAEVTDTYSGTDGAHTIAVSPGGGYLAAVDYTGQVRVWDTESGGTLFEAGGAEPGYGSNLELPDEDGGLLYMTGDGVVHEDFLDGGPSRTFAPAAMPENGLSEFVLSPGADRLYAPYTSGELIVDEDSEGFGMKVWEFSTGEELTGEEDEGYVSRLGMHPDGHVFTGIPLLDSDVWIVDAERLRLHSRIG